MKETRKQGAVRLMSEIEGQLAQLGAVVRNEIDESVPSDKEWLDGLYGVLEGIVGELNDRL